MPPPATTKARPKGRAGAKTAQDEAARQEFERQHPRAAKGRAGGGSWIEKGAGMEGDPDSRVRQLQNRLSSLGYNLVADGRFGPSTDAAVRAFQRDRGLAEDGKVGDKTREALRTGEPAKVGGTAAANAGASSGAYGAKYAGDSAEARRARGDQNEALAGTRDVGTKTKAEKKAAKDRKRARKTSGSSGSDEDVEDTGEVTDGGSTGSGSSRSRRSSSTDTIALGLGMDRQRGDNRVRELQAMLDDIGMNLGDGGTDGKFGPDTKRALMRFQRKYGLKADGVFGRRTRMALNTVQKLANARERNRPGSSLSELADDRRVVGLVLQEADTKHDMPASMADTKGEGMKRCPACDWRNAKGKTKCAKCGADLAKKGDAKLSEDEWGGKPGTNWKQVGAHAKKKLGPLIKHYMPMAKPFTQCVADNTKRFGKERAERVCAVLKDLGRRSTKWRKGPDGHALTEADLVKLLIDDLIEAGLETVEDVDLIEAFLREQLPDGVELDEGWADPNRAAG